MEESVEMASKLAIIISLINCSSAIADVLIQVPEKSTLTSVEGQNEHREVKILQANEEEKITSKKTFELKTEGRIPVLLIPYGGTEQTKINIDAPKVNDVVNQMKQKEVDQLLSSSMASLNMIQGLIQKRRLDEALSDLVKLESRYPNIHFFDFTKASILLLQGNRDLALTTAKEAIKYLPDDEEGKKFIKQLEGIKP